MSSVSIENESLCPRTLQQICPAREACVIAREQATADIKAHKRSWFSKMIAYVGAGSPNAGPSQTYAVIQAEREYDQECEDHTRDGRQIEQQAGDILIKNCGEAECIIESTLEQSRYEPIAEKIGTILQRNKLITTN
jgi:hypothetical protein